MKKLMIFLSLTLGAISFANAEVLPTPDPEHPNSMTMPDTGQQSGTKPLDTLKPQPGTNPPGNNSGSNNNQLNNTNNPNELNNSVNQKGY